MKKLDKNNIGSGESDSKLMALLMAISFMFIKMPLEYVEKMRREIDEIWKSGVPPDQMRIMLLGKVRDLEDGSAGKMHDFDIVRKVNRPDARGDKL
ncbi:hypothetical protein JW758_00640 [Candidatus Peregrinibacteria bacterium]|nr:hypothetical protein [Candidatus Peregrinibacteria bacterium]